MSIDIKDELEEDDENYRYKETYDIDGVTYNVDIKEGRGESDKEIMSEVYITKELEPVIITDYDPESLLGKLDQFPQEIKEDLRGELFPRSL